MKITKEVPIDLELSPRDIAEAFWLMDNVEQAEFFNSLFDIAGGVPLADQLSMLPYTANLNDKGREVIRIIGAFSEQISLFPWKSATNPLPL